MKTCLDFHEPNLNHNDHNLNSYTPRDRKSFKHFFCRVKLHSQQLTTQRTHTCSTLSVQGLPCVFFHIQRERGVYIESEKTDTQQKETKLLILPHSFLYNNKYYTFFRAWLDHFSLLILSPWNTASNCCYICTHENNIPLGGKTLLIKNNDYDDWATSSKSLGMQI